MGKKRDSDDMQKSPEHTGSWRERVNGKPLDTLEWGTSVLNVPPSTHRLKSALGLTVGLFLGAELMKVLTGLDLKGNKVEIGAVRSELRPLYGKLNYNFHSDHPSDRWMRVVHNLVPGVLGAMGTIMGSKHYFKDREKKAKGDPVYLDEFEQKAEILQSNPWGKASGFSAMFSSVSGFNWLPIPNYGMTLGSRFTLASGRKVALPGVGKLWSNNHSIYPFGAPELIEHMIQYAVHNPSADPKQLEAMAQGVLSNWFEGATPQHIDAFVQEVRAIRDEFVQSGGVPEEMKDELEKELKKHFKGAGLEETLEKIGLNPLDATIGSNGVSGKIAELMGAGRKMDKLRSSYVEQYQDRQQQKAHEPSGPSIV